MNENSNLIKFPVHFFVLSLKRQATAKNKVFPCKNHVKIINFMLLLRVKVYLGRILHTCRSKTTFSVTY